MSEVIHVNFCILYTLNVLSSCVGTSGIGTLDCQLGCFVIFSAFFVHFMTILVILVIFQSDMGDTTTEDTGKTFTKENDSLSFFGE